MAKKPFSGKQKREQLKAKRIRLASKETLGNEGNSNITRINEAAAAPPPPPTTTTTTTTTTIEATVGTIPAIKLIHQQPLNEQKGGDDDDGDFNPNRLRSAFLAESASSIELGKTRSRQPLDVLGDASLLEVSSDVIDELEAALPMPKRPPWEYGESKDVVESREDSMFQKYINDLIPMLKNRVVMAHDRMSLFETSLEVWRQVWRVIEISDVVLVITDVRHPVLHFPPSLYDYVVRDLGKTLVLILNKIDLVPAYFTTAWKQYFTTRYPDLYVATFTSHPADLTHCITDVLRKKKALHTKASVAAEKAETRRRLLCACADVPLVKNGRRLVWNEEATVVQGNDNTSNDIDFQEDYVTVGLVGHPNTGKSSLLNGLMGKTVASVSRTPGHTKHFQTIFLSPRVRLCDSPGVVFPSVVDREQQILSGLYPISQVREPYTTVGYLCSRVPVIELLGLQHPQDIEEKDDRRQQRKKSSKKKTRTRQKGSNEIDENDFDVDSDEHEENDIKKAKAEIRAWSAWDVCEAWAFKRGYRTAKAGRLDVYRAANSILRLAVEGRIVMAMRPPGISSSVESSVSQKCPSVYSSCNSDDSADETGESDESSMDINNNGDHHSSSTNPYALLEECM